MQAVLNFLKRLLSRFKKGLKRQAVEMNPPLKPFPDSLEIPPEAIQDEQDPPWIDNEDHPHYHQYQQPQISPCRLSGPINKERTSASNEPNVGNKFTTNKNSNARARNVQMTFLDEGLAQKKAAAEIGQQGERISNYSALPIRAYGKQLRNLYIPTLSGERTEIDTLIISVSGIYVLETKNFHGWIYGNEDWEYWTVSYSNKRKYKFYNPVRQNSTHIRALQSLVPEIPAENYFSLIVFSDSSEFKRLEVHSPRTYVLNHGELNSFYNSLVQEHKWLLAREEVNQIFCMLKHFSNVSEEVKQRHIEDVNRRRAQNQDYYN